MRVLEQNCLYCGEGVIGRIDKKFCDDSCRSAYHNMHNKEDLSLMRPVNTILKKNRMILKRLVESGKIKIHQNDMYQMGFNFTYITGVQSNEEGLERRYCYDFAYTFLNDGWFELSTTME